MLGRLGDREALILALSPVLLFILIAVILILARINLNSRTAVTPVTVGPSNPAPTLAPSAQPIFVTTAQPTLMPPIQPTEQPSPSPAPTATPIEAPATSTPTRAPSSPTPDNSIVI